MKHALLTLAIFMMIASSEESSAQSSNDVVINLPGLITSNPAAVNAKPPEARTAEVSIRAMRDFNRSHKNVQDVKWFKSESGQYACFVSNGNQTKVVYDRKGNRSYSLISYLESKLERSVRDLIKSKYYDATIIGVHQFELDNKTVYAIKMLDQQSKHLTLKVSDGQIEDITSRAKK